MSNPHSRSSGSSGRPVKIDSDRSSGVAKTFGTFLDSVSNTFRSGPRLELPEKLASLTLTDIKKAQKSRIGGGGFGDVYLLSHPKLGQVVFKQLRLSRDSQSAEDQRRRALREGATWMQMQHPNILPCFGVIEAAGSLFIVSPYVENGELNKYVQRNPGMDRMQIITEIADALMFLHEENKVHGDIKGANVLVSDDIKPLICDFGLAKSASEETSIGLEGLGSVRWQSVELMKGGGGKTFASDVWAFGMLIYEILSGRLPFHNRRTDSAVIHAVVTEKERPPMEPLAAPSGEPYSVLWLTASQCWQEEAQARPSMSTVRWWHLTKRSENAPLKSKLEGSDGELFHDVLFSLGGITIIAVSSVTATGPAFLYLCDSSTRSVELITLSGLKDVYACTCSPDGSHIGIVGVDAEAIKVVLWDLRRREVAYTSSLRTSEGARRDACGIAVSPDNQKLAVRDGDMLLWIQVSPRSTKTLPIFKYYPPETRVVSHLIITDDSVSFVLEESTTRWVPSKHRTIYDLESIPHAALWLENTISVDSPEGGEPVQLERRGKPVFSLDGKEVLLTLLKLDVSLKLLHTRLDSIAPTWIVDCPGAYLFRPFPELRLAFVPDIMSIALWLKPQDHVKLLHATSGLERSSIALPSGDLFDFHGIFNFSPDGTKLALHSWDRQTVFLLDVPHSWAL